LRNFKGFYDKQKIGALPSSVAERCPLADNGNTFGKLTTFVLRK